MSNFTNATIINDNFKGNFLDTFTASCVDDLSITDLQDNTCEFYYGNILKCGLYDTKDFIAGDLCCACTGECTHGACKCINDLSSTDSYGDNCDEYDNNQVWCGFYDTKNFRSET